ncbi:MAG: hypothetical protein GXP62_19030 [Oligoflexia bacterium]|nr:hypothetical protein [Oligoflexia bacterium]
MGDVSVTLSEQVPTVAIVSWPATDGATDAWVDFGPTQSLEWTSPATLSDGVWTAVLVGLKADSTGWLSPVEQVDGGDSVSASMQQVQVGPLPSDLPVLSVSTAKDDHWDQGFLLTALVDNPAAAIMVDPDGDIVWWSKQDGLGQIGRTRLSLDGKSVWMMGVNAHNEGSNRLVRVGLDGSLQEEIDVGDGHHDFIEHDDGRLAWLTHDERAVDGGDALGDSLTIRQTDGSTDTLWSIWDWRDYDPNEGLGTSTGPGGGDVNLWTHCNSLTYQDGDYLIGSLGLSAIMDIDATTGQPQWTFGSSTSDFVDNSGSTDLLSRQHQFQLLDNTLLVFENGTRERGASRAVEFSFDPTDPQVEEVWTYNPNPDVYALSLGNPIRMDNGHTLVNFALGGQMDEVDTDGQVLWRLSSPLGATFGYAELIASLYPD